MAKYFITQKAGHKFWLDNETYCTAYNTFAVTDDSDYDGYYGSGQVLNLLSHEPVVIADKNTAEIQGLDHLSLIELVRMGYEKLSDGMGQFSHALRSIAERGTTSIYIPAIDD